MRVVALFRVSTEKQAAEGASLDAQQRIFREYVARNGWTVVEEFRGCESATQAASDRRVLQQVLAAVREHRPDALYVHEQSRLTRGDQLDVGILVRELRESRVKVIVNGSVRDMESIEDRFMFGIQSLVDRTEADRIKERLMRGKRQRAIQGRKASGPPAFGYRNPRVGEPGRGTLQIVEEKAAVVRRIFEMSAAGQGEPAIATLLNRAGIAAPKGGRWSKSSVAKVLMCQTYRGVSVSGVWVRKPTGKKSYQYDPTNPNALLVPDAFPAIVSQELWDAVHNRARRVRTGSVRMLTGLLWVNGVKVTSDSTRGKRYYRAPEKAKGHPWLPAEAADESVWAAFTRLATEPEFVERLIREANDPTEQEKLAQEIQFLEDRRKKLQRRLDRVTTMFADEAITQEEFKTQRTQTRNEIGDVDAELTELRKRAVTFDGTLAQRIVTAVRTLLGGGQKLDAAQKRRVLRAVVARVDIEAEQRRVVLPRDANGKIVGKGGERWVVGRIRLRLSLPGNAGVADTAMLHCSTG